MAGAAPIAGATRTTTGQQPLEHPAQGLLGLLSGVLARDLGNQVRGEVGEVAQRLVHARRLLPLGLLLLLAGGLRLGHERVVVQLLPAVHVIRERPAVLRADPTDALRQRPRLLLRALVDAKQFEQLGHEAVGQLPDGLADVRLLPIAVPRRLRRVVSRKRPRLLFRATNTEQLEQALDEVAGELGDVLATLAAVGGLLGGGRPGLSATSVSRPPAVAQRLCELVGQFFQGLVDLLRGLLAGHVLHDPGHHIGEPVEDLIQVRLLLPRALPGTALVATSDTEQLHQVGNEATGQLGNITGPAVTRHTSRQRLRLLFRTGAAVRAPADAQQLQQTGHEVVGQLVDVLAEILLGRPLGTLAVAGARLPRGLARAVGTLADAEQLEQVRDKVAGQLGNLAALPVTGHVGRKRPRLLVRGTAAAVRALADAQQLQQTGHEVVGQLADVLAEVLLGWPLGTLALLTVAVSGDAELAEQVGQEVVHRPTDRLAHARLPQVVSRERPRLLLRAGTTGRTLADAQQIQQIGHEAVGQLGDLLGLPLRHVGRKRVRLLGAAGVLADQVQQVRHEVVGEVADLVILLGGPVLGATAAAREAADQVPDEPEDAADEVVDAAGRGAVVLARPGGRVVLGGAVALGARAVRGWGAASAADAGVVADQARVLVGAAERQAEDGLLVLLGRETGTAVRNMLGGALGHGELKIARAVAGAAVLVELVADRERLGDLVGQLGQRGAGVRAGLLAGHSTDDPGHQVDHAAHHLLDLFGRGGLHRGTGTGLLPGGRRAVRGRIGGVRNPCGGLTRQRRRRRGRVTALRGVVGQTLQQVRHELRHRGANRVGHPTGGHGVVPLGAGGDRPLRFPDDALRVGRLRPVDRLRVRGRVALARIADLVEEAGDEVGHRVDNRAAETAFRGHRTLAAVRGHRRLGAVSGAGVATDERPIGRFRGRRVGGRRGLIPGAQLGQ
ncbi:hypothetical protein GCM10023321_70290 [Pseudonocardia eucalypti]|uniref:Uncharacterized protein n=1 Tax=Pseudonocardia eucalypti TaxID=648755 RepID=A0ABP9R4W5_9PSEU